MDGERFRRLVDKLFTTYVKETSTLLNTSTDSQNKSSVTTSQKSTHPYESLLPCYYQLSKSIVHEIKFGDIAVMYISTICHIVTGILILIGRLRCLKEESQ